NYGKRALSLFIEHARSDHSIDRIHTSRDYTDKQLIVLWFWSRNILIFQNLWATVLVNDNSFHGSCNRLSGEYCRQNPHRSSGGSKHQSSECVHNGRTELAILLALHNRVKDKTPFAFPLSPHTGDVIGTGCVPPVVGGLRRYFVRNQCHVRTRE